MAMHQMHLLQISLNIYVTDMPIALSEKKGSFEMFGYRILSYLAFAKQTKL
jgi:hypothetical protein